MDDLMVLFGRRYYRNLRSGDCLNISLFTARILKN
jgi:hypothetical protein